MQILTDKARVNLSEYISRAPVSLKKLRYEPFKGRVLFHTQYNQYFGENVHMFEAGDFLSELTQHIPPKGVQYIRRYGLYVSRTRGKWSEHPEVVRHAPKVWKAAQQTLPLENEVPEDAECDISEKASRKTWARLIAKIYEIDPFVCLKKLGRAPPGVDYMKLTD